MIKEIIPTTIVEEKLLGTTFSSEHNLKNITGICNINPKSQVTCRRINRDVLLKRLWNLSSVVAL